MSSSVKWIIWIIIIIVVLGSGYWYMSKGGIPRQPMPEATNQPATTTTSQVPTVSLPTGAKDSSDSALNTDAATIDAEIDGLSLDLGSIDKALSDQPIQQ